MYDVVIIGAGVIGCAVARELSRYERSIAVLEKEPDVCEGTSKANSGIVHAGFDAVPGSMKAKMNVAGNEKMEQLAKELDIPFRRNGSMVLCLEEGGRTKLEQLYEFGQENGVKGLRLLTGAQARELEPALSKEVVAALYAPTGGIVCPFELTIALAENAAMNGAEFFFDTAVTGIEKTEDGYELQTTSGVYTAKHVINAAGVYADEIHRMVSNTPMNIVARKGEYCLYDKQVGTLVDRTIFQLPTKYGKGVLVTPTVHGNLLLGPTATDIEDKEGVDTTAEGLACVREKASRSLDTMPGGQMITSFAGLRAHSDKGDFIIGEVADAEGFFDVAGIESPGLSSAPAIGEYVTELLQKKAPADKKSGFISKREGIPHMSELSEEKRQEMIAKDPSYAVIVCRCEMVTEGEILNAIQRPLGAKTLDGVKRRTRAGMGRCQAGFCTPRTMELLAREWNMSIEDVVKSGRNSHVLL
ncbi:MAG: NAD(P)/FAD-dependent oxidoreductase [Lachnospiraceae bacterium]